MLTLFFLLVVSFVVVIIFLYSRGEEFKKRAKEIIQIYNLHEEYIIKNSVWKTTIIYPKSEFYVLKFKNTYELTDQITIMITDAIKCYKKQNVFTQSMTENLLLDVKNIQRKLMYIYLYNN